MQIVRGLVFFLFAGVCEIGGGYLIWIWLRNGKSSWYALPGAAILILYGMVATLQPSTFGRAYAAYGGVLVVIPVLWGWQVEKVRPDRFDLIGGVLSLTGMAIIMYWPWGQLISHTVKLFRRGHRRPRLGLGFGGRNEPPCVRREGSVRVELLHDDRHLHGL